MFLCCFLDLNSFQRGREVKMKKEKKKENRVVVTSRFSIHLQNALRDDKIFYIRILLFPH